MKSNQVRVFTGISGIVTFCLYGVVAVLMFDAPQIDANDQQILGWVKANRTVMLWAAYLFGLCVMATFFFLAGLWGELREREGGRGVFSMIGLAGGYSIFTLALGGFAFVLSMAYRAEMLAPATAKVLNDLSLLCIALTGFPTAVSMIGFTVVLVQSRTGPVWLPPFSILITVAHLISGGAFAASGMLSPSGVGVYIAPVMYYLWILAVSVLLLMDRLGRPRRL